MEQHKSCDQCGRKKKKCSGEKPCARCMQSDETCSYSRRRPRTPKAQLAALRAQGSTSHPRLHGYGRPMLKRARLRASAATGLLGMEENSYLCDFFGSMGFMPFTTQSGIRETMIKIILPTTQQQSAVGYDDGEEDKLDTIIPGGRVGNAAGPADPSACTFWSAVAIGALVKGRPIESVTSYLRLAVDAATNFSGPANPEMAKAWTILSYFHGLMGDQENYHKYLELAASFLGECVENGTDGTLPVGLAEIIRMGDTVKLFDEDVSPGVTESLLAQELPRPQLGETATEGELCRHIFQSARVFEEMILAGILCRRQRTISFVDLGEAEPTDTGVDFAFESATAAESAGSTNPLSLPPRPPELVPKMLSSAAFDRMLTMLEFRRLEEAVESPSVGSGIGGLVINDRLLYEKAARGDTRGALERVERCVDIYERYPGLNRFCMGAHKTHILIVILVALATPRAKEVYIRLRAAYNVAPPPGFLRVPLWEEWRGVSAFCDKEACRCVEALLAREDMASSSSPPSPRRVTNEQRLDDAHGANITRDRGSLGASFELARSTWEGSSAVVGASSEGRQTCLTMASVEFPPHVAVPPQPIGGVQGNVWGSNVVAHEAEELDPDVFAEGTEASLTSLRPKQALQDETEEVGLAAEDWLEALRAIDLSETDGALA